MKESVKLDNGEKTMLLLNNENPNVTDNKFGKSYMYEVQKDGVEHVVFMNPDCHLLIRALKITAGVEFEFEKRAMTSKDGNSYHMFHINGKNKYDLQNLGSSPEPVEEKKVVADSGSISNDDELELLCKLHDNMMDVLAYLKHNIDKKKKFEVKQKELNAEVPF